MPFFCEILCPNMPVLMAGSMKAGESEDGDTRKADDGGEAAG